MLIRILIRFFIFEIGRNETLLRSRETSNVQDDETDSLRLECLLKEAVITGKLCKNMVFEDLNGEDIFDVYTEPDFDRIEIDEMHQDALENLAVYIIKRLQLEN